MWHATSCVATNAVGELKTSRLRARCALRRWDHPPTRPISLKLPSATPPSASPCAVCLRKTERLLRSCIGTVSHSRRPPRFYGSIRQQRGHATREQRDVSQRVSLGTTIRQQVRYLLLLPHHGRPPVQGSQHPHFERQTTGRSPVLPCVRNHRAGHRRGCRRGSPRPEWMPQESPPPSASPSWPRRWLSCAGSPGSGTCPRERSESSACSTP